MCLFEQRPLRGVQITPTLKHLAKFYKTMLYTENVLSKENG